MKSKKIFITALCVALLFAAAQIYARMFSNSVGGAYEGGGDTSSTAAVSFSGSISIEELVIKGAEYFFKANADISLLSEKVEVSDIWGADFFSIWWAAYSASDNMSMALYYYRALQEKANQTPYNPVVIDKLMVFDYEAFQAENALLADVFTEVKGYLAKGDVRGLHSRTSRDFVELIKMLEAIKGELNAGKIPSNANMWKLNQLCVKTHMFGQYAARVFEAIK